MTPPPPAPIFSMSPSTVAAENAAYTYSPKERPRWRLNHSYTSEWTGWCGLKRGNGIVDSNPSAVQGGDEFTLEATSSEGGRATQSWTVTPSGTVSGSWIDTYWTVDGPAQSPINWAAFGLTPLAIVPQTDGSATTLNAVVHDDGTFTISNVPGGYYWFQFANNSYWTSSSTIDFGADISGRRLVTMPVSQTTTFNFDVAGSKSAGTGRSVCLFHGCSKSIQYWVRYSPCRRDQRR